MEKILVAKAYLINSGGLILVLRRSETDTNRPLTWDLPGGSVEDGEDPKDAVIRETEEESGIKLNDPRIFITKTTNKTGYVIRLLYYAYVKDENIIVSSEHDLFKWVKRDQFRELNIPEYYKDCLDNLPK